MRRDPKPFKVETVNRNRLPPRRLFSGADPKFNALDAHSQYQEALAAAERLFSPPTSLPLETVDEVVAVLERPEEPKETYREQRVLYPVEQNNHVEDLIEERRRSKIEKMRKTRAANKRKTEDMDDILSPLDDPKENPHEVNFEEAMKTAPEPQDSNENLETQPEALPSEMVQEETPDEPLAETIDIETTVSFTEDDVEVFVDSVPVPQPIVDISARKASRRSGIGQRWMERRLGKWAKHALRRA